ncbi:unnamed protein product, partial [marine sediment metagenome]
PYSYSPKKLSDLNEIERNLVNYKNIDIQIINNHIYNILKIIQDTENVYTFNEYKSIIKFMNNTLNPKFMGHNTYMEFSSWNLHQARNLKFQDMVWGGLVGNKGSIDDDDNTPNYTYRVTVKADGLRKYLVFNNNNIWLIMYPGSANLIFRSYDNYLIQDVDISYPTFHRPNLNGYIIEGELIPLKNRKGNAPQTKYLYYGFDVLSNRSGNPDMGDVSIQNKYHHIRMRHIKDVIQKIFDKNRVLQVYSKEFISFFTVPDFYRVMREIDGMRRIAPYEDDGFIFMPDEMPYSYSPKKLSDLNEIERNLVNYPDICKWKPYEKLTIDFAI